VLKIWHAANVPENCGHRKIEVSREDFIIKEKKKELIFVHSAMEFFFF